ncbi:MAG: hypothetical protein RMK65_08630, partial [Anaerolineae bacterium]|nr:hypothetical protein [Anaerolineae bacterium]
MDQLEYLRELVVENKTKILLLVMDGLGGLPITPGGPTELEAAHTPNMDALAARSICGLSTPIAPGIAPGSGPAHLALFGYDPFRYEIGRGVLEALGIGFDLQPQDIAAGNFCTLDPETGVITDRRVGRIPTEVGADLCAKLRSIQLPGVQVSWSPSKSTASSSSCGAKGWRTASPRPTRSRWGNRRCRCIPLARRQPG